MRFSYRVADFSCHPNWPRELEAAYLGYWSVMHMWVTHNQYFATYEDVKAAILELYSKIAAEKLGKISRYCYG